MCVCVLKLPVFAWRKISLLGRERNFLIILYGVCVDSCKYELYFHKNCCPKSRLFGSVGKDQWQQSNFNTSPRGDTYLMN